MSRFPRFLLFLLLCCSGAQGSVFGEHVKQAFSDDVNHAYLLELGDDALLARVNLIREAEESIKLQTFIWAADETGAFMFWELYKAAERGVKVRLLIDDLSLRGNARIVPFLAMLHKNIEIRHYNPLAENIEIGALQTLRQFTLNFGKANHRMHNKIVVVDGDYTMPDLFRELDQCADNEACMMKRIVSRGERIDEMVFVADHPGKHEDGDDLAETTESIVKLMQLAEHRIVMQTPCLVAGSKKFFSDLIEEKPDLDFIVSTNSLGAADHFYAYAFSYKNKKRYLRKFKWQIHEMKPDPPDYPLMVRAVPGVVHSDKHYTCIHSKTYLFDDDIVWLSSFNMDPRSQRLNTEAGIILRDREFFDQVDENIMRAASPTNAWTIGPRRKVPILSFFYGIVENIFSLIPIANIWPFTYSTSYALREGGEEMPFFDKRFHDNYKPVGQFPGVEMSPKAIKTRLTKAFFGPAEPII
ncbi:MAG: hypothetical protein ISP91_03995 [Pseudomonadales bacterium]|nr:hypothetical protein [Pseudomonadales bacterium]